jgi:hypothetical protein
MNGPFGDPLPHTPGLGVPLPAAPIPQELLRLHYVLESLSPAPRVLQLVAAGAGEGTSTIAGMLARVAAERQNRSVLLLQSGGPAAPGGCVAEAWRGALPLKQSAAVPARDGAYWRARLDPTPELAATGWSDVFAAVRREFDMTLLDCRAAQAAPDAVALARYCDGTILVVRAEAATCADVLALRQEIERVGGRLVGAVFNRERQHMPNWLRRWV